VIEGVEIKSGFQCPYLRDSRQKHHREVALHTTRPNRESSPKAARNRW